MRDRRQLWAGFRWRLRASRRLWSLGVTPNMPFLPPGTLGPGTHGKIDEPEAAAEVETEMLHARGWALFPSGPPARVEVWLGERPLGRARVGLPRPDIEALTGDPMAGVCGFELTANLGEGELPSGPTAVRAVAISIHGERHELDPVPVELAPPEEEETPPLPPPRSSTPRPSGGAGRRILVSTHQLNLGGAQLYLLDLLREMTRQRLVEATVISALDGVVREDLEALGIPVHIASPIAVDDLSGHVGRVEELTAWAVDRDFEAVLVNTATAHSFAGAEVAAELGIPAIWAIHESFPPAILWAGLERPIRRRAEDVLSQAALAIFEADATRRIFEPLLAEGRGLVLPYGLDLGPIEATRSGFDRAAARRRAGLPEDAEVILCVGTVEPRKAQLPLAQAFGSIADRHPRARLVFVGARDDADSDALRAFVEASELGDRIELIPVTPDVLEWYALADLFVCASDIESLPRTVLEAMALETPVLATSVFGLPELIDDGETGWLCEPRDMRSLAAALERALDSSPQERQRIGHAARELVEDRHALERYGREVGQLIDRAAAGETAIDSSHATAG